MHKKFYTKDIYVDYDAMADIPEDVVKQDRDLTAFGVERAAFKKLACSLVLISFFCFLLGFTGGT